MHWDRRWLLAFFGGLPVLAAARASGRPAVRDCRFASCRADREGRFFVSGLTGSGDLAFDLPLPGRGHSLAVHPTRPEVVALARRPGDFALAVDLESGQPAGLFEAPAGRHFYGHGTFVESGDTLLAPENRYETGEGVIGIYDARSGYRRLGELPSHGIGPHDLQLMPDGRTLVVAVGGIRTHPETGRSKLNIETMAPSLNYLELESGRLLGRYALAPKLHKLSIRHLDVNARGRVAIAMQYEGDRRDRVPLVGLHDGGEEIRLLEAPAEFQARMRLYTGSVAFDTSGDFLAVSSPRGGLITLWNGRNGAFLGAQAAVDGSGVAQAGDPGAFLIAAGDGAVIRADVLSGSSELLRPPDPDLRWDNHLRPVAWPAASPAG